MIRGTGFSREYDLFGNVIQEELATGLIIRTSYDDFDRPVKRILPDQSSIFYEYEGTALCQIKMTNASEEKVFSWIRIQYGPVIHIDTSDGKTVDARVLAAEALGWDQGKVAAETGYRLAPDERSRLDALLARREAREPVAYLTGRCEFWSLEFAVTENVLVPRPDSETLIEAALAAVGDKNRALGVLDLGTGSGCLLLALLSELPAAGGLGVDVSEAALAVAARNAAALGLEGRADFMLSDWDAGVSGGVEGRFDLVAANPPYVADGEFAALEPEVARFEPRLALAGGADGLDCYRLLAPRLGRLLAAGGKAFVEIGAAQAEAVTGLFESGGLRVVSVHPDLAGRPRVIEAENILTIKWRKRLE